MVVNVDLLEKESEDKNMRIDRVKMIALMAERDMTICRLSELSGISRLTISQVKSGKSCAPTTATAIAKALNVAIEEIEVKTNAS